MHGNGQNVTQSPPPQNQPQRQQQYVVHHEFGGSAELTTTLVHAISDVTGTDVTETEFTLNDYANPEALNRLFKPKADDTPRASGQFTFTIWGCQVTIFSNGQITIVPPSPRQQSRQV